MMSPGSMARRVLGSRFQAVGEFYRAFFVDMNSVITVIQQSLPHGSRCLDIGAGDGLVANLLLNRRPDLAIDLIDVAPRVGDFVDPRHASRVTRHANMTIARLATLPVRFDAIIIADVMHHVPAGMRRSFLAEMRDLCVKAGVRHIVIKDIEPSGLRSRLSVLSDRYVTGDRAVSLIGLDELTAMLRSIFEPQQITELAASMPDHPNYCLAITLT